MVCDSIYKKAGACCKIPEATFSPRQVGIYNITMTETPGSWFNRKISPYQYRESHCGDKMVVRSSYLHNGISCTGKMTSLYWIRGLMFTLALPMYISVAVMVALFIWKFWGFPPTVSGLYNITLADTVISGCNLVLTILSPLYTSEATMVAIFISQ